ncbi:MAG: electron transfer flavoprotein subunit alpha/FixB family protein [Alphaproteobacteria bacterium]|nr:electron transfer flavoprotein subunit alpha/FixB family protein [Alphaproteobacteria bacterium]NCQ66239.1 electron transfer flavoprotein subunit alpha/FixB family protein [Alphaproteobacteria bacterium]NCT06587.1 electron transfer flavoprotein subunit alpha/FixB family protein [Alphaproteobacteria bacterium]
MSILILAEHNNTAVTPATLSTITAALQIEEKDIHLCLLGSSCEAVAKGACNIRGVAKVLVGTDDALEHPLAETYTEVLKSIAKKYTHVLAPATTFGKNILPRLAAQLDVGQLSDIISVESPTTFKRPIYAGNGIATVESFDSVKLMTVRATAFDKAAESGGSAALETLTIPKLPTLSTFVSIQENKSDRPELTSARVVVSGGRGLQNAENFKMLEELADCLGGAIGASRAAVDAGYVPNDYQVGQTGKVVAPDLYIAVGISGAIQHLAGMKDSKVIVAVNKDEDAPIFQIADYGLVGDLFEILPELTRSLAGAKQSA